MVISRCIACGIPGAETFHMRVECANPACRCYTKDRLFAVQQDRDIMRKIWRWAWTKHLQENKR